MGKLLKIGLSPPHSLAINSVGEQTVPSQASNLARSSRTVLMLAAKRLSPVLSLRNYEAIKWSIPVDLTNSSLF